MSSLRKALQPVITDIRLEWSLPDGLDVLQIPNELPPLYKTECLTAYGVMHGSSDLLSDSVLSPRVVRRNPTTESDQSISGEHDKLFAQKTSLDLSDAKKGDMVDVAADIEAVKQTVKMLRCVRAESRDSEGVSTPPYTFTYKLISRFSRDSRDEDDGARDEERSADQPHLAPTTRRPFAEQRSFSKDTKLDTFALERLLHEVALKRRMFDDGDSFDATGNLSRTESQDTLDRVENWATTGHPLGQLGNFDAIRRQDTESPEWDCLTMGEIFKFDDVTIKLLNGLVTVIAPEAEVPHVTLRGIYGGQPFVRQLPIDLTSVVDRNRKVSNDLNETIHQIAAKEFIRDFERQAMQERDNESYNAKSPDNGLHVPLDYDDIDMSWKKKVVDVSKASNVVSNYTQFQMTTHACSAHLPHHVHVLPSPGKLAREMSRRSQRQRNSGFHSSNSTVYTAGLGRTVTAETNALQVNDEEHQRGRASSWCSTLEPKQANKEIRSVSHGNVLNVSKMMSSSNKPKDNNPKKSGFMNSINSFRNKLQSGRITNRHHYLQSTSFTSTEGTGTLLLMLVNEQHPEGFWNLDENLADAIDVNLDHLQAASPIVPLPPRHKSVINCGQDIQITVEDMSESPSIARPLPPSRRNSLVRQSKVNEPTEDQSNMKKFKVDEIFYNSGNDSDSMDEQIKPETKEKRRILRQSPDIDFCYDSGWQSQDISMLFTEDFFSDNYFEERLKPTSLENRIWASVLALAWLEHRCTKFFTEWQMMAGKTDRWIHEQKLPAGIDVGGLKAAAAQVLMLTHQ